MDTSPPTPSPITRPGCLYFCGVWPFFLPWGKLSGGGGGVAWSYVFSDLEHDRKNRRGCSDIREAKRAIVSSPIAGNKMPPKKSRKGRGVQ